MTSSEALVKLLRLVQPLRSVGCEPNELLVRRQKVHDTVSRLKSAYEMRATKISTTINGKACSIERAQITWPNRMTLDILSIWVRRFGPKLSTYVSVVRP